VTETALRLRRLARPHARARALAMLLGGAGAALAAAALGLALAPRLSGVALGWVCVAASAAAAWWAVRRVLREAAPAPVGRLVETAAHTRAGSIVGVVTPIPAAGGTSPDLLAAADARAARVVDGAAPAVDGLLGRTTRRRIALGAVAAVAGAALFIVASPASGRAAAFWNPLRAWRDARAPVRLAVDRRRVRRGDSVTVSVTVPGATRATLWTRGPGEAWRPALLALDADGRAARRLGPLETDLFVRAASGGRSSAELKIDVALPAFLAELALTARFPGYIGRADEPLLVGPDPIVLPAGTEIVTNGMASVPLAGASWTQGSRAARLRVDGARVAGRFTPATSGIWVFDAQTRDGAPFDWSAPPELHLVVVPDSAPVVALPVPGRDTTLPLSMRQPLVVDVRDDHGIARLTVVSWRVSRTGRVGEVVRESLDVSGAGDRAIIQGQLDAQRRGLLPGDTLRVYVEALDNAPAQHRGRSPELALRLPSMEELRAAAREAARAVAGSADSLSAAQQELSDRTRDLAQERNRDASGGNATRQPGGQPGTLPFQATERAEEIARQQAAMSERVAELARAVNEIARAAEAAGVNDTAFQNRLREVQEMLERALTPELEQRLRELQEALARLDPEATRQALQRLAEAQQDLKRELERSEELFRRAAIEGELASLAQDAEDLARRQAEWAKDDAARADSSAAAAERELAARTDSLAQGLDRAARDVPLQQSQSAARRAQAAMQEAAAAAQQRNSRGARAGGREAADSLDQVPRQLRGKRDSLASAWKQEALEALDRALGETAWLAAGERDLTAALRNGQTGAAVRGKQAAVEEGTRVVGKEIAEVAGRHALVPPQLEAALGMAQNQMRLAREQLEQGDPNAANAAAYAEQSLDALNALALALLQTSRQVAGAQSGSGFQEAMEQLARMAGQQQGLNGDAQGLLPMMMGGGQAVLQQLRALAARQRQLAEQLERMQAEGSSSAAGPLAAEARELARQLENGRLDPRTIQRQERLYRRLLDAGRTLSGQEPDDQKERVSRAATGDSVHVPGALAPGATGAAQRVRYPTWEELARLTPEQRRIVLEYFRLLNAAKP